VNTDYYAVLDLWPSSSIEEIKKKYFKLAKLYHPDVAGDTDENRQKFKKINEAFTTLSDPEKRREYDEILRRSTRNSDDSSAMREENRRSASLAYQQARSAMKEKRFNKASILLKSAVKYDENNPEYNSWYGYCLAMNNSNLHQARDACKKAVQMEFYNPVYHANLGFVYFKAGLKNLAVKHFSEALKWDRDNPLANRYMNKMENDNYIAEGPIDKLVTAVKSIFS
jgi:curved DNA-binding protein CbpA